MVLQSYGCRKDGWRKIQQFCGTWKPRISPNGFGVLNRNTKVGPRPTTANAYHPDRDKQFRLINSRVKNAKKGRSLFIS